jgi:fructose-1,6-bisphosphatase/sedoheptulose 1,7-bisphosphatase-like protein
VCHVAHLAATAFHAPKGVIALTEPPGPGNNVISFGRAIVGYVEKDIVAIGLGRGAHNDAISKFDETGPKLFRIIDADFAAVEGVTVGA